MLEWIFWIFTRRIMGNKLYIRNEHKILGPQSKEKALNCRFPELPLI